MATKAVMIPAAPIPLSFSLKINSPMATVVSKLSTYQRAPTIESWSLARIAGSQARVPIPSTTSTQKI